MRTRPLPLHPLLFAVFPILSLYTANTDQMPLRDALGTLFFVLAGTGLLWAGLTLLYRDLQRAAIPISIALLLFFSFTHLLLAVKMVGLSTGHYDTARLLTEPHSALLAWLGLETLVVLGTALWSARTQTRLGSATQFMNFFGVVLLIATLTTWALPAFQKHPPQPGTQNKVTSLAPIEQPLHTAASTLPDIYYIILDGYGRDDILSSIYNIDDRQLLESLRSNGFYIAEKAHSNYTRTALSLASSLNFMHLNTLGDQIGEQASSAVILFDLIEDNRTFRSLQDIGYQVVLFSNGITFTSARSADVVLGPAINLKSFQSVLINNTPLSIFLLRRQYDWHRQRIQYTFDHLPEVAQMPGPQFVMLHILAPHPPFVFGPQGQPRYPPRAFSIDDASDFLMFGTRQEYVQGYRDQVEFISASVRSAVEQILRLSSTPPVIILQGDHGPGSQTDYSDTASTNLDERFSILNALLFPGADPAIFYPELTPVNTFRLLFNTYFGASYPLLEDHSYIAPTSQYYQLIDVTGQLSDPPANP